MKRHITLIFQPFTRSKTVVQAHGKQKPTQHMLSQLGWLWVQSCNMEAFCQQVKDQWIIIWGFVKARFCCLELWIILPLLKTITMTWNFEICLIEFLPDRYTCFKFYFLTNKKDIALSMIYKSEQHTEIHFMFI